MKLKNNNKHFLITKENPNTQFGYCTNCKRLVSIPHIAREGWRKNCSHPVKPVLIREPDSDLFYVSEKIEMFETFDLNLPRYPRLFMVE